MDDGCLSDMAEFPARIFASAFPPSLRASNSSFFFSQEKKPFGFT
jgi:hypothetical protein